VSDTNQAALDADLAAAAELVSATPDDDKLRQVRDLAQQMLVAARKVELAQDALERAEEEYRILEERDLPKHLQSLGLKGLPLDNGVEIMLKDFVSSSLDKDMLQTALLWLNENGLGDLIKNNVTVSFGRGEDEKADALVETLSKEGFTLEQKKSVHSQSLNAAIREHLEQGKKVDTPAIRVFQGTVAKIKLPKNTSLRDILGS
jgi:hypothetical protein